MRFQVYSDNRSGRVFVQGDGRSEPREEIYNISPGENMYSKLARQWSLKEGSGRNMISVSMNTESEFRGYARGECSGLSFYCHAQIKPPQDPAATTTGIAQETVSMGIRLSDNCQVALQAKIDCDLDIVEIRLIGPSHMPPILIYDRYERRTITLLKGEYTLQGAYQLGVRTPHHSLGGRPLIVSMSASIDAV